LVVQEDEAVIVRNMFIWYTQERLSVGQITDRLTKLRVPTPSDRGRKVAQRERGVGQWSKSSVARILRCPTYTGVMYHFRYRRAKKSTNVTKRPEQDWVGVPVPVIIDKAIWEVAQRRLDDSGPTDEEIDVLMLIARELHTELAQLTFERQRTVIDLLDLRVRVETDPDGSRWAWVTCRIATDRLLISGIVSTSNL
jgi:hypothetical protein